MIRNPLVMFGLGPVIAMVVGPRIATRAQRPRMRHSVLATDIVLVAVDRRTVLADRLGETSCSCGRRRRCSRGRSGIWLFYVQHQFEDAYWQSADGWDYADAALRGSSYLKLPKVLQFFTGNIGLHHVHHLNARIPNYNLQRAHDENPVFAPGPDAVAVGRAADGAAQAVGRGPAQAGHVRAGPRGSGGGLAARGRAPSRRRAAAGSAGSVSVPVAVSDDAEVAGARLEAVKRRVEIRRRPLRRPPSADSVDLAGGFQSLQTRQHLGLVEAGRLRDPPGRVSTRGQRAQRSLEPVLGLPGARRTTSFVPALGGSLRGLRAGCLAWCRSLRRPRGRCQVAEAGPAPAAHDDRLTALMTDDLEGAPPASGATHRTATAALLDYGEVFGGHRTLHPT